MEAGPVESVGDGVDLAEVDARVEVAERLGDRLDPLVEGARLRELPARAASSPVSYAVTRVSVAGTSWPTWSFTKAAYRSTACCFCSASGPSTATASPVTVKRALADAVADHARLAHREVVAGLHDDGQAAGCAGGDVLDLADDAQPVVGEQVELADAGRSRCVTSKASVPLSAVEDETAQAVGRWSRSAPRPWRRRLLATQPGEGERRRRRWRGRRRGGAGS